MEQVTTDSLQKRYIFKLLTNLLGLLINLFTQAIIPRGLGPKAYGDFNFLTNFFNQIIGFLDLGTSTAFYTKLSQRPKENGLVVFYLYFSALASGITLLFVLITHLSNSYLSIWPGQGIFYIYLAAIWGILTWFIQVLNRMTDAYGLTVPSEIARMIQKLLGLILIVILYLIHRFNLVNFFYYNFVILILLVIGFIWIIRKNNCSIAENWRINSEQVKKYFYEFYEYSAPLITFALVGLIVGILDRWLLQQFAGSEQQGFYSLSYQIGAICFLFTSAMTPLLMREFSIAYANEDITLMAHYFRRYIPMLYSIAAYFSCFIAVQAATVVHFFGGGEYQGAIIAVMIMAFYPIHQTYGQLSGSVFYATGQTRLYRNIGILFMILGLPITYFLIAPEGYLGLNAGATGLAIKMVALQLIGVNVQLYYNAKFLGLNFKRYLGHQVISVGSMLVIAWGTVVSINQISWMNQHMLVSFLTTGMIYSLIVMGLVYKYPILFGLNREDIVALINSVQEQLRK